MAEPPALTPFEQARQMVLERLTPLEPRTLTVDRALGRVLAEPVQAERTLPPWDNSAMDGFAVRSDDVRQAPRELSVVETIWAGQPGHRAIGPGECARIMTGGPLPAGADAVVMKERCRSLGEARVEIGEAPTPGAWVRRAGEDAREGEPLLASGTPLGVPELALLWAQGRDRVRVHRAPRVAILSTGNELCARGEEHHGRLVDTNGPSLQLAAELAGAQAVYLGIARDDPQELRQRLADFRDFDVVITSAGMSVGDRDHVRAVLSDLGVSWAFQGVAIKPGKPFAFGALGSTFFFGLPGNPASSLVTFELFVRPALRRLAGLPPLRLPVRARAAVPLSKPPGLDHFLRVQTSWKDGDLWAAPLATQTSGAVRSTAAATHLLHFPTGATKLGEGEAVELLPVAWSGL